MSKSTRRLRSILMTGASTALITGFGASPAFADPSPVSSAATEVRNIATPVSAGASVAAHKSAENYQENEQADLNASVIGVNGDIVGEPIGGTQSGTANSVSTNTIQANAQSNVATQSVDLALINAVPVITDPDDPDYDPSINPGFDGVGALSVQTSTSHGINSTASGDSLRIDIAGFQDGSADVQKNTIGASTTVNDAVQSVAGTIPNPYETLADSGTSALDTAGDFNAEGTVVVSTLQQTMAVTATAEAGSFITPGNAIGLSLTADDNNVVTSAPLVDSNAIAATTTLNAANNEISVEKGENPAFAGSAVVTNAQSTGLSSGNANAVSNAVTAVVEANAPLAVNTLAGALNVTNNSVSSAVTGNDATDATKAGNRIVLDETLAFTGAGTVVPGSSIAYDSGDLSQTVSADLAISSSQGNTNTPLSAMTMGNVIAANVQSMQGETEDGAMVGVDDNRVSASATGNAASSALASAASASEFSGSAAIANQQTNYFASQSASAIDNDIAAVTGYDGGVTKDSSVSAAGNAVSAQGYGNRANQSIALDANTLEIGAGAVALAGGTGGALADGNASASGGATIANLQSSYSSSVSATQIDTRIGLAADSRGAGIGGDTISRSTLETTDNVAESVARANAAGNSLSLASNNVGSGAGIVSAQIADSNSSVTASLTGSTIGAIAGTHVEDSDLTVSNNDAWAIASGGLVSNALNVDSNGLETSANGTGSRVSYNDANALSFSDGAATQPAVNAAFGVLSDQSTQADISATTGGSQVAALVEGNVTSSTIANTANVYAAEAYGNDAANAGTLKFGNVDAAGSIGAIVNTQSAGDGTSQISASASGGSVFLTSIEDNVANSGVNTSDNTAQALAYGNRATGNVLTVTGNNLDVASNKGVAATPAGGADNLDLATAASFSVQNAQAAHGSISATQLNNVDPASATSSANVLTTIGRFDGTGNAISGDVDNATVTSTGNRLTAAATGNSGVSGVSLTGNQVASSTGVQNFQVTDAAIAANIGVAGSGYAPEDPFTYTFVAGVGTNYTSLGDGQFKLTSGTLTIDANSLSAARVNYLVNQEGWTQTGALLTKDAADYGGTLTLEEIGALETGVDGNATIPESLGTPNAGGVTIAIARDVTASTLAVDGNSVAGSATGNSAANSLAVKGTDIAAVGTPAASSATPLAATADHALSNIQLSDSAELTSTVYSTFALDAVEGASIENSTLSVSGNSQSAKAAANTAANSVALAGNGIDGGSALSSAQTGTTGTVSSLSDSEIFAPAAINGSTLSLSNNSNTSLAVYNDVANTATVSGTNVGTPGSANAQLGRSGSVIGAAADHVLLNTQSVIGDAEVTSSATTTLYNEDRLEAAGRGLNNSSATISGNSTIAEASSNRASNALALNGSAAQAASAGVMNVQGSTATVEAFARTDAGLVLNGNPAASGSSATIADNRTTALARGNSASNALDVTAGSNYGALTLTGAGSELSSSGIGTSAQAAVLNAQTNDGAVSATSQNVTYTVAFNGGAGVPVATGSTVGVNGNSAAALAYGNTANNTLTLTALNTGTPTSAVVNYQSNTADITATASAVHFGASSNVGVGGLNGSVTNSTFGVNGNSVTATAVGNNGVNVIAAR